MKTPKYIKSKMYPFAPRRMWGANEKSISEWLKDKGYNLLKIRQMKIFHLDSRCTEEYFNILVGRFKLQK